MGFLGGFGGTLADNLALQQQQKRQLSNQLTLDDIKQHDAAIQGILANPKYTPEERAGALNNALIDKYQSLTPLFGRRQVEKILASKGLKPFQAQTGTVPGQPATPISAGGNDLQQLAAMTPQVSPQEMQRLGVNPQQTERPEGTDFSQIPNVQPAPLQEPAKGPTQVSLAPPTTADVLASGAPTNQFIPVTRPDGTTFMVPAKLALPYLTQDLRNAGAMERTQANIGAKPGQWKLQVGTKNGEPYAYYHSEAKNKNTDLNGNELEDADLKDFVATGKGALKETIVPDPASPTGFAKIAYDTMTGIVHSKQLNVLPPRGFIASDSISTDNFGNQIVTHRQPEVPGVGGTAPRAPVSASPASAPPRQQTPQAPLTPQVAQPQAGQPSKAQGAVGPMKIRQHLAQQVGGQTEQPQVGGAAGLDENGHIRLQPGMNAQVAQFANRLLDGADLKDIPTKAQAPAQQMAGQYGWKGQGFLTPKDQMQVRESEAIIQQLANSPALSVLDNPTSRAKITEVLHDTKNRSLLGSQWQQWVASKLNPQEQEFVTLFNQAVGRISGLSGLIRPGSRTTEATINRLMTELPFMQTTTNSQHAKDKLAQLQSEINIARQKGQFLDNPPASSGGFQVGQSVKLKDGRTVTIKAIHDDGTFDAE